MKTVQKSICLLIFSISCFSQNKGNTNLNLVFYDDCSNKIIKPEFEIFSMSELNYNLITVYKEVDNWVLQYSTTLKTKNDTIQIPKILFAGGSELHSERWAYFNCEKVCNGKETDFYPNGKKRTEGTYENGKPIEIKEYRENGTLRIQYFYENLTLNYKRIDYYDKNENLEEYEIYNNKRRKTIIRTFDKNDNLINKLTEKKYI